MNNGPLQLNDYQYELQQQRKKKKLLIVMVVLSSFYIFSRGQLQSKQNSMRGQNAKQFEDKENGDLSEIIKSQKILQELASSIDGYKVLYRGLYDRYEIEQRQQGRNQTGLLGNPSNDILFATLYSLKKKNFFGQWRSEDQQNQLGYFDNNKGDFRTTIDIQVKSQIKMEFDIIDDQYIDHKYLQGQVNIPRLMSFSITDEQVKIHNLTLTFDLQNELQSISRYPKNKCKYNIELQINNLTQFSFNLKNEESFAVNLEIKFNEQNDSEKYINKQSPYLQIKLYSENKEDIYSSINISAEVDLEEEVNII